MASILYHEEFLRETLPMNHALFFTTLFMDQIMFKRLKELVICGMYEKGDIAPTGIPPDIVCLLAIRKNLFAIQKVPQEIGEVILLTVDNRRKDSSGTERNPRIYKDIASRLSVRNKSNGQHLKLLCTRYFKLNYSSKRN